VSTEAVVGAVGQRWWERRGRGGGLLTLVGPTGEELNSDRASEPPRDFTDPDRAIGGGKALIPDVAILAGREGVGRRTHAAREHGGAPSRAGAQEEEDRIGLFVISHCPPNLPRSEFKGSDTWAMAQTLPEAKPT